MIAAIRNRISRAYFDVLLGAYGRRRLRQLLQLPERRDHHTYTCFFRSPIQMDALLGPVLDFLHTNPQGEPLSIQLFACSTGAEAFTWAAMLSFKRPDLRFRITASDLHSDTIAKAKHGVFSPQEVLSGGASPEFIAHAFDRTREGNYQVKASIQACIDFAQGNLLDPATLKVHHRPGDIVVAQNVFCHLNLPNARQAFLNILPFAKPRAVFFLDGTPLDLREELTAQAGLTPLDFKVRQIHQYARLHIPTRWWSVYYGLEPFCRWVAHPTRRYATIFLRGAM